MKKYLTITVREQMQGMTVEKVIYDYMELTKKQVSRAKFRPDCICKNKVQCRVCLLYTSITKYASGGDSPVGNTRSHPEHDG